MKVSSNPYTPVGEIKTDPDIISSERSKAGSKASARYPSGKPSLQPGGGGGDNSGKMKTRAYTPGGPSGS
jgi:hypothetical protein